MNQTQQYKSDAFAAIHETMDALHQIEAIDEQTMRHFDETCLKPITAMEADDIKALREREYISQLLFALYLNVPRNLVSDWEQGIKKPGGPALRLLNVVQKHGIGTLAA